jgi:hypothetical protein
VALVLLEEGCKNFYHYGESYVPHDDLYEKRPLE